MGAELHRRGILYAPDYVINAGGLISVYGEIQGWTRERAMRQAREIYGTLRRLFSLSRAEGIPTYHAADRIARERVEAVAALQRVRV